MNLYLKVPTGTEWPVVGRKNGSVLLRAGFLEAVASESEISIEQLTEEMVVTLLDAWYAARIAAGFPTCPHIEALRNEVAEEICQSPDPTRIKTGRKGVGLTQTQAAAMVCVTLRNWQQWEAGERKMHPGLWALFNARIAP